VLPSITLVSVVSFDQKIDLSAVIGIGLIIIGVVVLRVFSDAGVD
jgi:multidrug transporter EmrE-like cation transporter